MTDTLLYYQQHAHDFIAATQQVDMTPLYQRFLGLIGTQGRLLDAGCGSGRDARASVIRARAILNFFANESGAYSARELYDRMLRTPSNRQA